MKKLRYYRLLTSVNCKWVKLSNIYESYKIKIPLLAFAAAKKSEDILLIKISLTTEKDSKL